MDMNTAGYSVAQQTFSEWVFNFERTGCVGVEHPKRAKQKSLTEEQQRVLVGRVLHCNNTNVEVHLKE